MKQEEICKEALKSEEQKGKEEETEEEWVDHFIGLDMESKLFLICFVFSW